MESRLPDDHGLPAEITSHSDLLPRDQAGDPSLTTVQFEALAAGVAHGQSMLCVAPTSTGKTLVGVWGAVTWLKSAFGRRAVYLVTHKALARQKFSELRRLLGNSLFEGDLSCIVLANGDIVQDGTGAVPPTPLESPLLIATYEKYLAMLAGSGVRGDMTDCAIICDEIQILGDETRGRAIEILLTLLKRAAWGQLIGLSAVLDPRDATALVDWLGIRLIQCRVREKHLRYECRTTTHIHSFDTGASALGVRSRGRAASEGLDTISIVREIVAQQQHRPVVVFCMTRDRVYQLSGELAGVRSTPSPTGQALLPGFDDETAAARELSIFMQRRVAFHTSDLRENERAIVETAIEQSQVDVVVATSTLAAGVNFPLGSVIFDNWKRWDGKRRLHAPLPESEFQNMAGRSGRMGFGHALGRVIYVADGNVLEQRHAQVYLDPDRVTPLTPRLTPKDFGLVVLQLLSAGLCTTEDQLCEFLLGTLSAHREREANRSGLDHWRSEVATAIAQLRGWGFVL